MLSRCFKLFSESGKEESKGLNEVDFSRAVHSASVNFSTKLSVASMRRWSLFCDHLRQQCQFETAEKLMLFRAAYSCIDETIQSSDLAQFLTVSLQLKESVGLRLFHALFSIRVPEIENKLSVYTQICQFIIHLQDRKGLLKSVQEKLPNLEALLDYLREEHAAYLCQRYPERDIDSVIHRFSHKDELVQFPLGLEELNAIKGEYTEVLKSQKEYRQKTMFELTELAKQFSERPMCLKQELIGLITEVIRRIYKISPYDTQLLAFIALTRTPEHLKGRIAQIKTGEGKSMLIAMLATYMGCQGSFVDVVTSAGYLAIRDERHYAPFYKAMGLTSGHICHDRPEQSHFQGQILYGTNTEFESALLRDGLGKHKLRCSWRNGQLVPRGLECCIVDEVDNLVLDAALNSVIISVPGAVDYSWMYHDILSFVRENRQNGWNLEVTTQRLMAWFHQNKDPVFLDKLAKVKLKKIKERVKSAVTALFETQAGRDYLIKSRGTPGAAGVTDDLEVRIIDYRNTGRSSYSSQWRNGLHQMLQAKHHLTITPESVSSASLSHPTYFNLYCCLLGLTGTVGEEIEREEIKRIYNVDSFDVPPHFPSLRVTLPPVLCDSQEEHFERMYRNALVMKEAGRPVLILLETIIDTEAFCQYMKQREIKCELINENQRESEDYLIGKAGESGNVTVATNTAGRGTDILLSPESKAAGGLHVIFGFYASNLRVLAQGFGRASRQGQPGSCELILNKSDVSIQELIRPYFDLIKMMTGLQTIPFDGPADAFVELLDTLRSKKIKSQSTIRALCAQKEAFYFEKLQAFFKDLESLHQHLDDAVLTSKMLDLCEHYSPVEEPREVPSFPLSDKALLMNMSTSLLTQQGSGHKVDWNGFVTYFKCSYESELIHQWALFYNQLHDNEAGLDLDAERQRVDKLYQSFQQAVGEYQTQPETYLLRELSSILDITSKSLLFVNTRDDGGQRPVSTYS